MAKGGITMRYALLIYHDEAASGKKSQQEQQQLMQDYNAFTCGDCERSS
jgi:hypothetical protein